MLKMVKNEINNLITELNEATEAYDKGCPIMSDPEWDKKYFELCDLENEFNIYLENSPTQCINFTTVSELNKVTHNHPMLSLAKTKDVKDVKKFIGNKKCITMAKLDGLTCSLTYVEGKLVKAETRGNGIVGEDITHNAFVVKNIPKKLNSYYGDLVVDGEIVCLYQDFEEFAKDYKHPRNFAAGSIRLLDSKECSKRKLSFIAWDAIEGLNFFNLSNKIDYLNELGFETVPYKKSTIETVEDDIKFFQDCSNVWAPFDGAVIKYDDCEYYESLGRTDHHFRGGLAYKFYDEEYSTTLKNIEWTMGRTGVLTPVAIFEPIDIDGTTVERASLHNISIMHELSGGFERIGDTLYIFKANQIIPQVSVWEHNGEYSEENHLNLPVVCPICGEKTRIIDNDGVRILVCENEQCEGKLINRLDHFCGKKGLDIKGISKATLGKLVDWGWVENIQDIFQLKDKKSEWISKPGFGEKSVQKILDAIDSSKKCTLAAVLSAAGIPLIGQTAARDLSNKFETYEKFRDATNNLFDFSTLNGFGYEMDKAISNFNYSEIDYIVENFLEIQYATEANLAQNNNLEGITIVITGKLKKFKNRDELKALIESHGGKVAGSVSKNTKYLINNDSTSESAKNISAKKLGVEIITEEEFIKIFDF